MRAYLIGTTMDILTQEDELVKCKISGII